MAASENGPTLEETDPRLLEILRRASDEWGPAGVARAAAALVKQMAAEASGFCDDCPDHEACSQGAPCAVVKKACGVERLHQHTDWCYPVCLDTEDLLPGLEPCREFDKWSECVVCGSEYARVCRGRRGVGP